MTDFVGIDFLNVLGRYFHHSVAQIVNTSHDIGCPILIASDVSLEALETATDDPDTIAHPNMLGDKIDGRIGIEKHKPELLHLAVRDDRQGMAAKTIDRAGFVSEEIIDIGLTDYLHTLFLSDPDKQKARNNNPFNLFLATILPTVNLFLRSDV